jgi:4-diphosphocytidyl-2-C-methyl-D-erythritol kinase
MTTVLALAPAKLNLGLEVVGKRPDGYHNIVTVMQTVSIFDRLTFAKSSETTLAVSDLSLSGDDNLILAASRRFEQSFSGVSGTAITLRKRIPAAAGLGGASSDAAATIRGLAKLHDSSSANVSVETIATSIGSDVSFLLSGGTALVEGRGEIITSLSPLSNVWFVVLVPAIMIDRKTATLYGSLLPTDFTSGQCVRELAAEIGTDHTLDIDRLGNAFLRPLRALRPEITSYERQFISAGAPFVSLSGAGPALYTATGSLRDARTIMSTLRQMVRNEDRVFVCRPVGNAPLICVEHADGNDRDGTDGGVQAFERSM